MLLTKYAKFFREDKVFMTKRVSGLKYTFWIKN